MHDRAERAIPPWAALLFLVVLAIAAHAPILSCTFFSDDFQVLHRLMTHRASTFFRPLADWSLRINLAVTGAEPWAFRLVNLALLGMNGWLVFLLGRQLFHPISALVAGVLFVAYPFHLEPQAWIIGRGIALATAFTLGALLSATGNATASTRVATVTILGMLGALCYESALLLPFLIGAWWLVMRPKDAEVWRRMMAASALVVGVNLIARFMSTGSLANDYGADFFSKPMSEYLGMAAKVLGRSFLPPCEDHSAQLLRFDLLAATLMAIAVLYWRKNKNDQPMRRRAILLTALYGISAIIAIVGGVSTRTSESDRFLYLPSAFLCILVVLVLSSLLRSGARIFVFGAIIIASLAGLMNGQTDWVAASRTIRRVIAATPEPPAGGRLFVHGLPGDHNGAFIFRHGFHGALLFAGRDTSGVLRADTLIGPLAVDLADRGDTLRLNKRDRIVHWDGHGFVDLPAP